MRQPFYRQFFESLPVKVSTTAAAGFSLLMPIFTSSLATAAEPDWWTSRSVVDTNATSNNYAVANLGQAKHMATQAWEELNAVSETLAAQIDLSTIFPPKPANADAAWYEQQKAVLNLGQLKAIAKPFYDALPKAWVAEQMARNGITNWAGPYPWDPSTPVAENYKPARIGQLKLVFGLRFSELDVDSDTDQDGLKDWLEREIIYADPNDGMLEPADVKPWDDFDGDGLSNLDEYLQGTDPTLQDSDGDGLIDSLEVDLAGHWALDEADGNSVIEDSADGNLDGQLLSGTRINDGVSGRAVALTHEQQIKITPGVGELNVGDAGDDFSVSFWFRRHAYYEPGYNTLIKKGNTGNDRTFGAYINPDGQTIHARVSTDVNLNEGIGATSTGLVVGQWAHLAYVHEAGKLRMYINGQLDSEVAVGETIANDHAFYIGKSYDWRGVNGDFDEVMVHRRALKTEDIKHLVELDTDADGLPDIWERAVIYADPNDSIDDLTDITPGGDLDADSVTNLQEYLASTDPLQAGEDAWTAINWQHKKFTTTTLQAGGAGSTLKKTSGDGGRWSGAASSARAMTGDGAIQCKVSQTTAHIQFGLNDVSITTGRKELDYAFHVWPDGILRIYEKLCEKKNLGAYSAGDKLEIRRVGSTVKFYRNDVEVYVSNVANVRPLFADVSMYTMNGEIYDTSCTGFTDVDADHDGMLDSWEKQLVDADAGDALNSIYDVKPGDDLDADYRSNIVEYEQSTGALQNDKMDWIELAWQNASGVTVGQSSGGPGSQLEKLSGASNWDSGADSVGQLTGDGGVTFRFGAEGVHAACGLNSSSQSNDLTDIDYCITAHASGFYFVIESGVHKGDFGEYSPDDEFSVERDGDKIYYSKNGRIFYVSTSLCTDPLEVDSSLHHVGSKLTHCAVRGFPTAGDIDGDGIDYNAEYALLSSMPITQGRFLKDISNTGDVDGDGITDGEEILNGTDPLSMYSGGGTVAWPHSAIATHYRTDKGGITTDNGQVTAWTNEVDPAKHLMSPPSSTDKPDLITGGGYNGLDVVRAAAADRMRIESDGIDMLTPEADGFTVLGAFRMGSSIASGYGALLEKEHYLQSGFRYATKYGKLYWYSVASGGDLALTSQLSVQANTDYLMTLDYGVGEDVSALTVNGQVEAFTARQFIIGDTDVAWTQYIGGATGQAGDWGELILTKRKLTHAEQTLLQDYLLAKHQGTGPLAGDLDSNGTPDWQDVDGIGLNVDNAVDLVAEMESLKISGEWEVKVTDRLGTPLSGRTVDFKIMSGSGSFGGGSEYSATTDANGKISIASFFAGASQSVVRAELRVGQVSRVVYLPFVSAHLGGSYGYGSGVYAGDNISNPDPPFDGLWGTEIVNSLATYLKLDAGIDYKSSLGTGSYQLEYSQTLAIDDYEYAESVTDEYAGNGTTLFTPLDEPLLRRPIRFAAFNYDGFADIPYVYDLPTASSVQYKLTNLPTSMSEWTADFKIFRSLDYADNGPAYNDDVVDFAAPFQGLGEVEITETYTQMGDFKPIEQDPFGFDDENSMYNARYYLYLGPEFYGMTLQEFEDVDDVTGASRARVHDVGRVIDVDLPLGSPFGQNGIWYQLNRQASNQQGKIGYNQDREIKRKWKLEWYGVGNSGNRYTAFDVFYWKKSDEQWSLVSTTEIGKGVIDVSVLDEESYEAGLSLLIVPLIPDGDPFTADPYLPEGAMGRLEVTPYLEIKYIHPDTGETISEKTVYLDGDEQEYAEALDLVYDNGPEPTKFINKTVNADEASGAKYRKISLLGRPVGDGKPQSDAESDEEPEESYVDALTRDFNHSTTDLYIPVPASELALTVRRNASPFTWSSAEDSEGRGVYSGLLAEERPDLAFGAGWSSNLSPRVILSEQVDQYENLVALMDKQTRKDKGLVQGQANTATVIDEHGMSYQFVIGYNNGAARFMPMPTASNQLQNYLATLELVGDEFVFKKKYGTTLRFDSYTYEQLLSNNRKHGSKQYTKKRYGRLKNVTDRYGEQLIYTYRYDINLIPAEIYVASRPSLGIAIHQDANGRVTSVVDPKGNVVNYTYQSASGSVISGDSNAYPEDVLLASVTRGGIQTAQYRYNAAVEDDPRDTPLVSEDGKSYDIRAWAKVNDVYEQYSVDTCHVNLSSIKDAYGNETSISYAFDESRSSFVREARYAPIFKDGKNQLEYIGFFKGNVPVIGLPRDVSNIQTPGGRIMGVSGTHLVEATDDGIEPVARQTMVADVEGNVTTYTWGGFAVNEFQDSDLDYVYSEQVSKTHVIGYQTMTIAYDGGGTESLAFSPSAGYALQSVVDFSGNTTTYNYTDPAPAEVSNFGGSGFSVYGDPNSETKITSGGNVVRNYQYDSATRVMKEIEDALGRKTNYTIAANGLRTDEVVTNAAGVKMSEKVFAYGQNGFAAFMSSSKVKAFATNPELDDPAWVSDIVTLYEADSNGRVQRSAVDMNGNSSIDSGDLISSYTYDRNGNKLSVTDPEGNTTYFHYDALNRLVKVVNPDGSSKQMVYDYRSNKVMDIDELGLKTGYVYDAGNRLVTTVRDMNRNLSYNATSNTFSGIDTNTDLISSVTYNNLNVPVAATDTRGYITVTEYDYLVRPTKVITPKENTLPDTTPDAGSGYVSSMFYGDNAGGSAFNVSGFKPTKATDPRGYRTYAKYDDLYRPVESYKEYDKTNGYFSKSLTTYDAVGNALTVTTWRNPFQITESQDGMTFTATSVGTEQKQSVLTDYDGLNRATMVTKAYQATDSTLTSEVYSRYTSTGFVHQTEEQTDHNGQGGYFSRINDVEYDAAGRAVKAIGPEVYDATSQSTQRPVTLTEYTPNGNKAAMINPLNKRWDYVYDARNRLVQELQPAVFDYETGQTRRPTSTTEYDEVGNVVHTVNPRGHISTVYYDDAFRAVETHAPLAPIDGLGLAAIITKSEYDAAGNVTRLTDANGNVTLNTYDSLGRLAATTSNPTTQPLDGTVHADDIVVENSYDAVGNLVQVIAARDEIGDLEKDHVTGFVYDGHNRLLEKVWNADDAARKKTEYSYYDAALLTHTIDPKGQKIAYEYDEIFRLQTVEYDPDNTTTHPDNRQMSYDLAGRQKSVVYPNESSANQEIRNVSQTYDALDRVLSETSNGVTHTTAYDLAGNTLLQTYGQTGRTLTCTYDSLNRLSTCTESPSGGGTSRVTSYAYDLVGGITEKSLPSGQKEFKSFDSLGRTAWIENRKSNGDVIGRYDYGYDAVGNVTVIEESYPAGNLQPRLITNLYDNLYRLRYESSEEGAKLVDTEYQYDKANNRTLKSVDTTVSGTTTTETWNYTFGTKSNGFNSNQLVSYTRPDTTVVSFTYDANGNRATRTHQANTDTYSYDLNNRLVSLDLNSSADSAQNGLYEYGYDHRTRRVLRDESDLTSGKTTRVVFSGGLSVQEHEQNAGSYNLASPAVEYVRGSDYGGGVGGVLYTLRGGVPSYNAYNSRGDVVSKTDDSEAITWQASYEAFGTRTEENGSTDDRQKANTKDEDPTGLLNEGMRYRDLEAGVFITRDPAGFVDGPNVYTYVRQNPWTAFDPLGLWGWNESNGAVADGIWNFGRGFGRGVSNVAKGTWSGVEATVETVASNATLAVMSVSGGEGSEGAKQLLQENVDSTIDSAKATYKNSVDTVNAVKNYGVDKFVEGVVDDTADNIAETFSDPESSGELIGESLTAAAEIVLTRKVSARVGRKKGPAAPGRGVCFVAGTVVLTESGEKPIEDVEEGERVWAYNGETQSWELHKVLHTIRRDYEGEMVTVGVGDERIEATTDHPFWVVEGESLSGRQLAKHIPLEEQQSARGGRWVDAGNLLVGDLLLLRSGDLAPVVSLSKAKEDVEVFNLNIDAVQTYSVTKLGILVHNRPMLGDVPGAGTWKFNKKVDLDWRLSGKGHREALDEAFKRTGHSRKDFEVTKWGRDANGKSFPVEYRHKSGAEVNIDLPHTTNGPAAPHVGYQTAGKRGRGGAVRGHIILDNVPYNR